MQKEFNERQHKHLNWRPRRLRSLHSRPAHLLLSFRLRLPAVALVGVLVLASCGDSMEQFTLGALAGPGNVEAVDYAVSCDFDAALRAANREATAENPSRQLFTHFVRYAVYTETGQPARAARAIDEAYADPGMNPDKGTSRAELQKSAEGVLEGIRSQRAEETGSPRCAT